MACSDALIRWNRDHFGNIQRRIRICQREFQRLRNGIWDLDAQQEERVLLEEMSVLLEKEEILWKQRSRQQWLREGDRNTRYFHSKATDRMKRNLIRGLENEQGVWISDLPCNTPNSH